MSSERFNLHFISSNQAYKFNAGTIQEWGLLQHLWYLVIKFIHSEKATKFCKISTVNSCYVVPVKSTEEISQNFVAFSEYMNFNEDDPSKRVQLIVLADNS